MTSAEPARFVHDEPDGRLRNDVSNAIRLEEVQRGDDAWVVHFPAALSQAELDDESRYFFTETLCLKLAVDTP